MKIFVSGSPGLVQVDHLPTILHQGDEVEITVAITWQITTHG